MPSHQLVTHPDHVDSPLLSSGSKIKIATPGICLTTPPLGEYIAWLHHCLKLTTTNPTTGAAITLVPKQLKAVHSSGCIIKLAVWYMT
jgi:hypothetical protein